MRCPTCNYWNVCPRCTGYTCVVCGEDLEPKEEEPDYEKPKSPDKYQPERPTGKSL